MSPVCHLLVLCAFCFLSVHTKSNASVTFTGPKEIPYGTVFSFQVSVSSTGDSNLSKGELQIGGDASWYTPQNSSCSVKKGIIVCSLGTLPPGTRVNFTFTGVDESNNFQLLILANVTAKGKPITSGLLNITVDDRQLEMIRTCPTLGPYSCQQYSCCGWDEEALVCDAHCSGLWTKDRCELKTDCTWNAELGKCWDFDCLVLSEEDCDANPHCMKTNTSCSTLNCFYLSKDNCAEKDLCVWSKKAEQCDSFQCNLQTSQEDCGGNPDKTCFWNGTGCFDNKCHSFNQTGCQASQNNCLWVAERKNCEEFSCSLLSKDLCSTYSNCSWDPNSQVCETWKCSNMPLSNCTLQQGCYYNQTLKVCQNLPCEGLTTKDQCYSYNKTLACTWFEECINFNCSVLVTNATCSSKYFCQWTNGKCLEKDCSLHRTQTECIQAGQCAWSGSFCSRKDCSYYVFEPSCSRLPFCSWNGNCFSFPCQWYTKAECDPSPYCLWNDICESCQKKMNSTMY
eukprot:TRINITY_DN4166_c0_g1_i1.p1 TRINITY_DN4166_c0_g1~~TRINITY_DN4166_c0_g1_i1.p1  ORF type:complete len:527 (-),score=64.20 TRINITY_DN4166_c0_g1_i1:62-1588(-)